MQQCIPPSAVMLYLFLILPLLFFLRKSNFRQYFNKINDLFRKEVVCVLYLASFFMSESQFLLVNYQRVFFFLNNIDRTYMTNCKKGLVGTIRVMCNINQLLPETIHLGSVEGCQYLMSYILRFVWSYD